MGFAPPGIDKLLGSTPSSVSDVSSEMLKKSLGTAGLQSGDNAVSDSLQPIARIASKSQSFLEASLMGRGLTVQRFSAAQPGGNWRKSFPYRFLVTRVNKQGRHSVVAEYRLPINPQELTINTPYAISTTVTSRGILEEHNGAPLKQITINGTTGIMIEREASSPASKRNDFIGTIFGGTADAIQTARNQVTQAKASFGIGATNPQRSNQEDPALTRTGYYQYHMMKLFLDTYAETKKAPNNQDLRLIFENTKDVESYIVTPVSRLVRRSVASPMEYLYTIQLLAWGTVPDFRGTTANVDSALLGADVGDLRRTLNSLKNLRKVTQSFKNVISAVRADVESNIFGPINDAILLTKDILSIPIDIADLPKNLRMSMQTSVVANWNSLVLTNDKLKETFNSKFQSIINEDSGSDTFASTGEGSPSQSFKPDVLDSIDLTENIQIGSLQLNENQQNAVNNAVDDAKFTTTNEINTLVTELSNLSQALEAQITAKSPDDEEWDILYALNDSIGELYNLIANGNLNNSLTEDQEAEGNAALSTSALAFWNQTAQDNNIPFTVPLGKFAVPFPVGSTMEQIASTYLGDANRWLEIVALNGLQSPYIDEEGFTYPFVGNGNANQFNVGSSVNLYAGQVIYLSSNTTISTKRRIQAISRISDTNWLLTVDGPSDMAQFSVADEAQLKAFLPYTVNNMSKLFIPVDVPPAEDELDTPPITFLTEDLQLIKFAKIDWLLDSNYDLSVASDGFVNLSFGSTNLAQAAKLKMKTPPGNLLLHPGYGAGVEPGTSFADVNLEDQAKRISEAFTNDPRYNAPSYITLDATPGVLAISVGVSVSNGDGILPINLPLTS